jgi:hypothetical protein
MASSQGPELPGPKPSKKQAIDAKKTEISLSEEILEHQ